MITRRFVLVLLCLLASGAQAARPAPAKPAPAEVTLGHHLDAAGTEALLGIVERFNAGEKGGKVSLQRLSGGKITGETPNLMLIDDDDGHYMAGRRYEPIHRFMPRNGAKFDNNGLYPALRDAVDDNGGKVQALPLALSLPVIYWNKDAFRRAGLDPQKAPRTWWALQEVAGKLFDAGIKCPYASSWPVWVHVENTSTQHNEPFLSAGRGSTRLSFNSLVHVKHIALLSSWLKSRYFFLFGAADEADAKFASGECAVLTSGSNLQHTLQARGGTDFGVAELPYYDDVYDSHQNQVIPAGSALWAMAAKPSGENRLSARFLAYLLKPAVQQEWTSATGYLPMTTDSGVTKVAGSDGNPAQLLGRVVSERRQASDLRSRSADAYGRMRAILGRELDAVWANTKPPKAALDEAVRLGNALLNGPPATGRGP